MIDQSRSLKTLFSRIPVEVLSPKEIPDVPITGIAFDSREVTPGRVFIALTGTSRDGHKYIPSAIERGAAAVIGTLPAEEQNWPVPYLQVIDSRLALAHLSAAFYDFPGRKMTVVGVTGTDGKTTTSTLLYQILRSAGLAAGMVSTVSAYIGDQVLDTGFHVTTPEAPDLQRYLAQMVEAGLTHAVVEATSHGLAQERVTGVEFDIAVVTNITHEHLDYHGGYEGYRAAKAKLFQSLEHTAEKAHKPKRLAVLNRDDGSYEYLPGMTGVDQVSYGLTPGQTDMWAEDVRFEPDGTYFRLVTREGSVPVRSTLVGKYNVSNCLAAAAAAVFGLGLSLEQARAGIENLQAVPGRMERIDLGQPFTAIVDFAHTPNALKNALETARELTRGRVIAVFGSAGLRDREKRRMMADTSARLADVTVLTAEDPRTESLDDILAEMAGAAESAGAVPGRTYLCVHDRGEAIRQAVRMANAGDLVIACGKGHEQSMCFGETEYPWDDRTAMRAALAELMHLDGPEMPYLPTRDG